STSPAPTRPMDTPWSAGRWHRVSTKPSTPRPAKPEKACAMRCAHSTVSRSICCCRESPCRPARATAIRWRPCRSSVSEETAGCSPAIWSTPPAGNRPRKRPRRIPAPTAASISTDEDTTMKLRTSVATAALAVAALGATAAPVSAQPAPRELTYEITHSGDSAVVETNGKWQVAGDQLILQAIDDTLLTTVPLTYRKDNIAYPIAAKIDGG